VRIRRSKGDQEGKGQEVAILRGYPYVCGMDTASNFGLTDRAAARIAEIVADEGRQTALRVAVLAGGCSGFQYRFELDKDQQPDDLVVERGPAKVRVDPASLDGQPFRDPQPECEIGVRLRYQLFGRLDSVD
jgi:hypothetical protein